MIVLSILLSMTMTCCRAAVFECLRGVFSSLSEDAVVAFMPTINAHLRCAMTHLSDDVKLDSLQVSHDVVYLFVF